MPIPPFPKHDWIVVVVIEVVSSTCIEVMHFNYASLQANVILVHSNIKCVCWWTIASFGMLKKIYHVFNRVLVWQCPDVTSIVLHVNDVAIKYKNSPFRQESIIQVLYSLELTIFKWNFAYVSIHAILRMLYLLR